MYAELHTLSNFSFLRGASHPEELIEQAKRLNYRALALTDECSLAGVVRAHVAAREHGLPLIIGTELRCIDDLKLIVLATDRASYGALSRLISRARRATAKGRYALARADLENALDGCLVIWLPGAERTVPQRQQEDGRWLRERFAGRLWMAVELLTGGFDLRRLEMLESLGKSLDVPRVADALRRFDAMLATARSFASTLGGTLVDDNRAALTEPAIDKIRHQLTGILAKMEAGQIAAGGARALRLFS